MFEENSLLKRIGECAFWCCGGLRHISLQEGLEQLSDDCFYESGLEEITIPSSVTVIKDRVFFYCRNLRKIIFQEGSTLQEICGFCFSSSGLEELTAPPGPRKIDSRAFAQCEGLKRVTLNEGLEALNDLAYKGVFESSGVEEMTLPSTLKEICEFTFNNCNSLRTIYVKNGC